MRLRGSKDLLHPLGVDKAGISINTVCAKLRILARNVALVGLGG